MDFVASILHTHPIKVALAALVVGRFASQHLENAKDAAADRFDALVTALRDTDSQSDSESESKETGETMPGSGIAQYDDLAGGPPCLVAEERQRRERLRRQYDIDAIRVDTQATVQPITAVQSSDLMMHYAGQKIVSAPL